MTVRLSPQRWAILKRLAMGPIPLAEWRKFDQRFVRPMYLAQLCTIDRAFALRITDTGWSLHSLLVRGRPKLRLNPNADTFAESNDRSTFRIPRSRVN